tara:strand:- start:462 stop:653 length:192 start_codon:yes stop_codon:yes gene_type:complete
MFDFKQTVVISIIVGFFAYRDFTISNQIEQLNVIHGEKLQSHDISLKFLGEGLAMIKNIVKVT